MFCFLQMLCEEVSTVFSPNIFSTRWFFLFCRVLCYQVKKMEAGHHDLSKVTVAGDPQLLQKKIVAVRLAGPSKLQVFLFFDYHNFWIL